MNGTIVVSLANNYIAKKDDMFQLWTTDDFGGTPSWSLPNLPEGLYWDTTDLAKSGVLRITDDSTLGIGQITANEMVSGEVFTISGIRLGSFQTQRSKIHAEVKKLGVVSGTYIVRVTAGRNTATETIVIH
jgi:hypothetical protein